MGLPEMSTSRPPPTPTPPKKVEVRKQRCWGHSSNAFHCEVCYGEVPRNAMNGRTKWGPQGFLKRMFIIPCLYDHGKPVMQEKEEMISRENSMRSTRKRHLNYKKRLRLRLEKKQLDMCLSLRHTSIYMMRKGSLRRARNTGRYSTTFY